MNKLIVWLIAEGKRADLDYEMCSDTEDASYHQGEVDAYRTVRKMISTPATETPVVLVSWLVAELIRLDKALENTHDPEEVAYLQGVSDGYIITREMIAKFSAEVN